MVFSQGQMQKMASKEYTEEHYHKMQKTMPYDLVQAVTSPGVAKELITALFNTLSEEGQKLVQEYARSLPENLADRGEKIFRYLQNCKKEKTCPGKNNP